MFYLAWGAKNSILMLAMGMGYLVLYFAKREEKLLQALGYFLGTIIILYSGLCILLNLMGAPITRIPQRVMRPYYQQRMLPAMPQQPPAPSK